MKQSPKTDRNPSPNSMGIISHHGLARSGGHSSRLLPPLPLTEASVGATGVAIETITQDRPKPFAKQHGYHFASRPRTFWWSFIAASAAPTARIEANNANNEQWEPTALTQKQHDILSAWEINQRIQRNRGLFPIYTSREFAINNRPRKRLGYRTPLEVLATKAGGALGS